MRLYCAAMVGMRKVLQCAWIEASCMEAGTVLIAHLRLEQMIVCFEGW